LELANQPFKFEEEEIQFIITSQARVDLEGEA
jgi:hypothetical protein